jgi:hypothetical protein
MALTLASGISASDRYCTVNQPPTQPPGSYYRIGDEVVQHIGFATPTPIWSPNFTQLYIARAQLGTTAVSHLSAAPLTFVRPEFLSATAETDPGPFESGGSGGASGVLADPGVSWAPGVAVTAGYRIAETVDGALRVFEVTVAGTTDAGTAFTDYIGANSLRPLGTTITGTETWRYLGIVGQVGFDVLPGFLIKPADWFVSPTTGELAIRYTGDPTDYEDLLVVGDDNNEKSVWRQDSSGDTDQIFRDSGTSHRYRVQYGAVNFFLMGVGEDAVWLADVNTVRFFEFLPADGAIRMPGLPTADPAVAGQLWNDAGTLKVSAG